MRQAPCEAACVSHCSLLPRCIKDWCTTVPATMELEVWGESVILKLSKHIFVH